MSLRSRLIVGLLALAATGLVALAGITYAEQRSFLLDRVDQQVRSAVQVGARVPFGADPDRDGEPGPGPRPGPGRPMPGGGLPPGTWVYDRDASGDVVASQSFSRYAPSSATAPRLPARLPIGETVTVEPKGSGVRYRVLAEPRLFGGGTVVAAVPLADVDQTLHRLLAVEALVIVAILAALALLAWWLVRIGLRPLDRIGTTAGAIAAGDLSRRVEPATPRTEVGRLGIALNRMLDRLEQAFAERQASEDRLRRFLADASHELRTPLTSIRGYAELFRVGAARNAADTEKAMSRIEAEAARMGVLVEDLLTLARLDEVRDVVRAPTDLARLAADAVDDARATAPDREIDLRSSGPAVVHGDPHQLRQVLANLLRNALVHTPAGTPIEVDVRHDADGVALEVRDHGPGLPDGAGDDLFERFWRAEGGRERGRAGAGLGLAIVAGIVHAHGGEVHAAEAPGGGARFAVRLPA
ncbi:MAG TPA: HAMP domain-containing sensor histidine kinase [Baekduia sp.]|nr:HAMP domain-containing sensor histidine kinase [Baekduia sp.]